MSAPAAALCSGSSSLSAGDGLDSLSEHAGVHANASESQAQDDRRHPDSAFSAPGSSSRLELWQMTVQAALGAMSSHALTGLSSAEAARRLHVHGPNVYGSELKLVDTFKRVAVQGLHLLGAVFAFGVSVRHAQLVRRARWSVTFSVVLACYILFLLVAMLGRGVISLVSSRRRRVPVALPACAVLRDGSQVSLSPDALVPGDVVLLTAGVRVPADGRIVETRGLRLSRLALTGADDELLASVDAVPGPCSLIAAPNVALAESVVVAGSGAMLVCATGSALLCARGPSEAAPRDLALAPGRAEMRVLTKRLRRLHQYGILAGCLVCGVVGALTADTTDGLVFLAGVCVMLLAVPHYSDWVTFSLNQTLRALLARKVAVARAGVLPDLGRVDLLLLEATDAYAMGLVRRVVLRVLVGAAWVPPSTLARMLASPNAAHAGRAAAGTARELLAAAVLASPPHVGDALLEAVAPARADADAHARAGAGAEAEAEAAERDGVDGGVRGARRALSAQFVALVGPVPSTAGQAVAVRQVGAGADAGGVLYVAGTPLQVLAICAHSLGGGPLPALEQFVHPDSSNSDDDDLDAARPGGAARSDEHWMRGFARRTLSASECTGAGLAALRELMAAPAPSSGFEFLGVAAFEARADELATRELALLQAAYGVHVVLHSRHSARSVARLARTLGLRAAASVRAPVAEWFSRRGGLLHDAHYALADGPRAVLDLVLRAKAEGSIVAAIGANAQDAPVLALAHVGIALGCAGAEAARASAACVLLDDSVLALSDALVMARGERMRHTRVLCYLLATSSAPLALSFMLFYAVGLMLPLTPVLALGLVASWVAHAYGIVATPVPRHDHAEPPLTRESVARLLGTDDLDSDAGRVRARLAVLRHERRDLELLNTREVVRSLGFSVLLFGIAFVCYVVALAVAGASSHSLAHTWTRALRNGTAADRELAAKGTSAFFGTSVLLQSVTAWSMRFSRLPVGHALFGAGRAMGLATGGSVLMIALAVYVTPLHAALGTATELTWLPLSIIFAMAALGALEFAKSQLPTRGLLARGPDFSIDSLAFDDARRLERDEADAMDEELQRA